MKRHPKSKPEEPIVIEHIGGVYMSAPIKLLAGETRSIRLSLSRLSDDPEVVIWTAAREVTEDDYENP